MFQKYFEICLAVFRLMETEQGEEGGRGRLFLVHHKYGKGQTVFF
jgi:hypothetical protein